MSKKILIFSLAYYPHVGGAEIAIHEITKRIPDIEFHLLTMRFSPADAAQEKIGNVRVHRIGKDHSYLSKILFIPRAAFEARRLHRELAFDGGWAMMMYMLFPVVAARLVGLPIPYAVTLQDGDLFKRPFLKFFSPILRFGFTHASVVSAISTHLAGWARRMGYTREVVIIPNGADIHHFSGEPVAHTGIVLITTSRLVHKNAVDDVIKALALLPENVRFRILGSGPDEKMLKELAKKEGVEARVEFVGHIDHKDMARYLHVADIFVRPSRTEGQGSSFLEAMAAGLPIIATQEGGIADFLFDKKRNPHKPPTGFAVDTDNPRQIADAVEEILHDPVHTKAVIENARKLVTEKYDWDTIADDMRLRVFQQL